MKTYSKDVKRTETQDTINFLKIKIEALEKECIMLRSELADTVCD